MKKASNPKEETQEKKRRWALLPLLLVLLFLLLATSCIVGFRLGRTTDLERLGAMIDTIVLAPQPTPIPSAGATPGPEQGGETVRLLGVVRYTDGTPFTQGSVELRSTPRLSQLDEVGRFRFDQVEMGEHTITVLDAQGSALTSRSVQVTRDAPEGAYLEYRQELCILHIRLLTVQVNVELIMEEGPGGELELRLVDALEKGEAAIQSSAPSPAETAGQRPGGPSEPTETPAAATGEFPPATPTATPVTVPTVIPEVTPTAAPTETPAAMPTVMPTPTPTSTPAAIVSPSAVPSSSVSPSPSPSPSPSTRPTRRPVRPGSAATPTPTVTPTPIASPSPSVTPTATPVPSGETGVYHGESGQSWTQQAEIDLFRPLDGSAERLIAPGAQGYYLFRVENGRTGKVRFTLAVREGSFHVPLEFRLTDGEDPLKELSPWRTASLEAEMVSDALELEAGESGYYRIEWRWPFQGDDAADTALGTGADRTYTLKLTIRSEDAL